jgi:hypothetical protein
VLTVSAATLAVPSPASAATNNCTIEATTPALIPDPDGPFVAGGGRVACTSSAETITVHVEVHRIDNTFFPIDDPLIADYTATRRPGYQLLSVELVRSPRCRAGFSYYSDVTGFARWKTGSISGRTVSPTMTMC